jgi:hypothetical protein
MKILIAGIASIGALVVLFFAPADFITNNPAAGAAEAFVSQVEQDAQKTASLERLLVRKARKDRWWMLLVGSIVVAYQLRQKHQALFEKSLLYPAHDRFERDTVESTESATAQYTSEPERIAQPS